MTNPSPDKVAKLSVWAQDYIHQLEQRVVDLNRHVVVLSGGEDGSNVLIRDHVSPDRLLGRNVPVQFELPDGSHLVVEHAKDDDTAILVRATGRGRKGALAVTPQTSNAIKLRLTEY